MNWKNSSNKVGVIGAGAFGTAIANLLAHNTEVLLYTRDPEKAEQMQETGIFVGQQLAPNIAVTNALEDVAARCKTIFLLIPSHGLEELLSQLSPILNVDHMLIHGIKGLYIIPSPDAHPHTDHLQLTRKEVYTMSERMLQHTNIKQVGYIGGPNLAGELAQGLLAGIVVASTSSGVRETGKQLLASPQLTVDTHADILGIELCGVLKNILAIGTGYLAGLGQGENARALLMSKGLIDMMQIGVAMGAHKQTFLTIAGVGDLIATCNSNLSRNYSIGYQLAQGQSLEEIQVKGQLMAEGVKTVMIIYSLARAYAMHLPVVEMVYKLLFESISAEEGIQQLMRLKSDT